MTNYTYTDGRPAANLSPASQRASMQTNNDNNALIWTEDHYGFNDNDGGLHKKSTYVVGSDPGSAASQIVQYSKTSSGSSELFIQRDGVATVTQLTKGIALTGADTAKSTNNGQTFLPGGFLVKFGTSIQNATSRTVIFTTDANLTDFSTIYAVFLSPLSSGDTATVVSNTSSQFVMATSVGALTVYWWAIGI